MDYKTMSTDTRPEIEIRVENCVDLIASLQRSLREEQMERARLINHLQKDIQGMSFNFKMSLALITLTLVYCFTLQLWKLS